MEKFDAFNYYLLFVIDSATGLASLDEPLQHCVVGCLEKQQMGTFADLQEIRAGQEVYVGDTRARSYEKAAKITPKAFQLKMNIKRNSGHHQCRTIAVMVNIMEFKTKFCRCVYLFFKPFPLVNCPGIAVNQIPLGSWKMALDGFLQQLQNDVLWGTRRHNSEIKISN